MRRDLVLAADFGTSGVKVGLVDGNLEIRWRAQRSYPLLRPVPSGAEQQPEDWWAAFSAAVGDLVRLQPQVVDRIRCLVFAAQACGVVLTDAEGRPLRPAIVASDKRAAPEARALVAGFPSVRGYGLLKVMRWLVQCNGAPSLNGMDPPAKMLWLRKNEPSVWAAAARILDVRDWLVHRAAGAFVTTGESANLTWMMDTRVGREGWSAALCRRVGARLDQLPRIVDGTQAAGPLTERAAAEVGLPSGLPVLAGCSDVAAAALGSGFVDDGALHIHAGTSSWIAGFMPARRLSVAHSFATVAGPIGFRPLLIAQQESCGSALDWGANLIGCGDVARLLDQASASGEDNSLFLPWLGGERCPLDDDRLRGAFLGLGLSHGPADLARAIIEGIQFNLRWTLEAVGGAGGVLPLVGGVARSAAFAQSLSDALDVPVLVREPQFAGVAGAASLAADALGVQGGPFALARRAFEGRAWRDATRRFEPDPAESRRAARRYRAFRTAAERVRRHYANQPATAKGTFLT